MTNSGSRLLLLGGLVILLAAPWHPLRADDPGLPAELRWGGDASGGEPYIIEREGKSPTGFEAELAEYLAKKLGIKSRFVQKTWDALPQDLNRPKPDIDIVLNGYEWSSDRERVMASTIPYYAYRLRLIVRHDSEIKTWDDLARAKGARVGVLKDSAADRYLRRQFPDLNIESLGEDGTTAVMMRVAKKELAATVQDDPVVAWYMNIKNEFPDLRAVGEPIAPEKQSYYVIYVRKGEDKLRQALDKALREGLEDGSLRKIYIKYGLWEDPETRLQDAARTWPPVVAEGETDRPDFPERPGFWYFARHLAIASLFTIALAVLAMPLAILLGLGVAVGRLYGPAWIRAPLVVYVEVIRGTPVLLQLMVIYYFLPNIGLNLPAFWAGVLGLAINYGAYEAENYRAGLLAIPRGQMEAALALGMGRWTALRRIIIPQAVRLVIPPVTNDFISLFKDTSVCSVIAVTELMARYRTMMVNYQSMALEIGAMTAVLYLLMSYPLSILARRLEKATERLKEEEA